MFIRSTKQSKNSQGSALIITILLITAISTVLFSVARLTYSDLAQATRLEESITANYAAESGIELGLLSYRFNHEAETNNPLGSNCTSNNNCAYTETLPPNTYHGGSLDLDFASTPLSLYPSTPSSASSASASAPSASMRMWFMESQLGSWENIRSNNGDGSPKLLKDQTIELDLSNQYNQPLQFFWTSAKIAMDKIPTDFGVECDVGENECNYPQVRNPECTSQEVCNPPIVQPLFGMEFTLSKIDSSGNATPCDKGFIKSGKKSIEFKDATPQNVDPKPYISWQCGEGQYKLRIKPLIGISDAVGRENDRPYVYYAVQKPNGIPIDNGTTHIVSTGTYGSTRRTLTIDLDRSSTKLLGLYDLILGGLTGAVTGTSTVSPSPSPTP
ncbi:MAG: hypothetical protein M1338_05435 [Patescibacteria group bacterium]|nr:hypothetical protein [Patescibacteria group bacterium]